MPDEKPRLPWSMPPASPQAGTPAAPEASAPASQPALAAIFPSSKKTSATQAPIYAALLVSGIIIGALLATGWSTIKNGAPENTAAAAGMLATSTERRAQATESTAPALVVMDQRAGQSVVIHSLNIAKPTWVVVYVSREGKPGNALGARLYSPADKKGSVGLLRNTEPGQTYVVGLSVDNGDRVFSLNADKPMPDADGGPLWATFRAL